MLLFALAHVLIGKPVSTFREHALACGKTRRGNMRNPQCQRAARLGLTLIALAFAAPTPAGADGIADFYRGKELRLIIGASVGGGYDIHARAIATPLVAPIPRHPAIVPQDMPAG